MLKLDQTTRKLQAVLSGAVTTNQLPCMVSYSDDNGTTYVGGTQLTNTNSTTAVDICAAPGASTVRDIDYLSIRNRDTAAATVTVMLDDNGTDYEIVKAALAVGDQLVYTHGDGWRVINSDGSIKESYSIPDGDKGDITVSASGATWTIDSAVVTTAARTVLDDATVADMRTTLGVSQSGPAFRAYQSTLNSVTSSNNKITLNAETFDTDNAFDSTTNYRFQPSVAGYYLIAGAVQFATGNYIVRAIIYKNGSVYTYGQAVQTTAGGVVDIVYLNGSTDYVELYGYSATTQNTEPLATTTYLSGVLVR